jgi:hypothetical protein
MTGLPAHAVRDDYRGPATTSGTPEREGSQTSAQNRDRAVEAERTATEERNRALAEKQHAAELASANSRED